MLREIDNAPTQSSAVSDVLVRGWQKPDWMWFCETDAAQQRQEFLEASRRVYEQEAPLKLAYRQQVWQEQEQQQQQQEKEEEQMEKEQEQKWVSQKVMLKNYYLLPFVNFHFEGSPKALVILVM